MQGQLLREEIEEERGRRRMGSTAQAEEVNKLRGRVEQLNRENQQMKELLAQKDHDILKQLTHLGGTSTETPIVTVAYQCTHAPLIKQYERTLQLKEQELMGLRQKVEEWSNRIGFDRPISQRVRELTAQSTQAKSISDHFHGASRNATGDVSPPRQ